MPFVLPTWLSPSHPLAAAETRRWRKNWGWQVTRALSGLAMLGLVVAAFPWSEWYWGDIVVSLLILRLLSGLVIYLLLATSAAATVARTLNRTDVDLLRVTPMPVFEMVYARGAAIWWQFVPLIAIHLLIGVVLATVTGIDSVLSHTNCGTDLQANCFSLALPDGAMMHIARSAIPQAATHAGLLALTALAGSAIRPVYALALGLLAGVRFRSLPFAIASAINLYFLFEAVYNMFMLLANSFLPLNYPAYEPVNYYSACSALYVGVSGLMTCFIYYSIQSYAQARFA